MIQTTHVLNDSARNTARLQLQREAEAEFEAVFLQHFPRIVDVLMRLTGDRMRAEELANEAFWKLYRFKRELLLSGNVAGWLYRTATHAGIDAIRTSVRRSRYERQAAAHIQPDSTATAGPLNDVLRAEQRQAVQRVLADMKPAQAQILLMRASGASYRELAEALGVAVGGVGTLLNRAEAEFRKRYLELTGEKEEL